MNVLKPNIRITIETLLQNGVSQHEIEHRTGADRKTIRKYERLLKMPQVATGSEIKTGQNPPPRPPDGVESLAKKIPKHATSACEPHREWIELQVGLGRNAQAIYQDLVEQHGKSSGFPTWPIFSSDDSLNPTYSSGVHNEVLGRRKLG